MQESLSTAQTLINTAIEFCVNYSFQVLGAVIILIAGSFAANWAGKVLFAVFEGKKIDVTLSKFLAGLVKATILIFVVLIALGNFGITIAPFIAALGAVAFGASMAIQGPLSNYGAGISIILGRPFVVGDTISVAGTSGVVQEVKLACTILTNEDGILITIPNKHIVGEILYNSKTNKVVEGVIGISYHSDPALAVRVVRGVLDKFERVVKNPAAQVGVQEFADSSVNIGFRYWVPTVCFFHTSFEVNMAIFKALQEAGIQIPFPQREIRILSQAALSQQAVPNA